MRDDEGWDRLFQSLKEEARRRQEQRERNDQELAKALDLLAGKRCPVCNGKGKIRIVEGKE